MTIFVVVVHVAVCFFLILVILLQAGRGAGMSWGLMGGGSPDSIFGTKSSSFLKKLTTTSAVLFIITCFVLNFVESKKARSLFEQTPANKIDIAKVKQALEKIKESKPAAETPLADALKPGTSQTAETAK